VILVDSLGRTVAVPAAKLPANLRPPPHHPIELQVPEVPAGSKLPPELLRRMDSGRQRVFTLFPATPPALASYLAALDDLGNTAVQPGPLIDVAPAEPLVQGAKYWLGARGLRYSLSHAFTYTGVPDTPSGSPSMGYYSLKLLAKWAVYESPASGTAGWLSAEVSAKEGLGGAGANQSAQSNIGTLTSPTGILSRRNGIRVPELAWQQSFGQGRIVAVAGVVDQSNYLDTNTYANTGRGQFLNSALVNSMVVPLPEFNFGVNLQWQPAEEWYVILGAEAGNATAGETPWTDFSWDNWSVVSEIGFAPEDFLGLGAGVYRIQPFLAQAGGPTQGGVGFNFQQELGHDSPFAVLGRFGVGGARASAGASTQVGTGLVMKAPFQALRVLPELTNDLGGVGFVWSQPSATTKTVYHHDEYVAEAFYTLQLSPMTRVEPDIQLVWNPVFNSDPGPFTVVQAQFILAW
jgi:hypothetical protein